RVPWRLEGRERGMAWAARGGPVAILTDRARLIQVGGEGDPISSWLAEPDGRTAVRVTRLIAPGVVVAQLVANPESASVGETTLVDLATGRVLARASGPAIALDFVGAGDRLYALLPGGDGLARRL